MKKTNKKTYKKINTQRGGNCCKFELGKAYQGKVSCRRRVGESVPNDDYKKFFFLQNFSNLPGLDGIYDAHQKFKLGITIHALKHMDECGHYCYDTVSFTRWIVANLLVPSAIFSTERARNKLNFTGMSNFLEHTWVESAWAGTWRVRITTGHIRPLNEKGAPPAGYDILISLAYGRPEEKLLLNIPKASDLPASDTKVGAVDTETLAQDSVAASTEVNIIEEVIPRIPENSNSLLIMPYEPYPTKSRGKLLTVFSVKRLRRNGVNYEEDNPCAYNDTNHLVDADTDIVANEILTGRCPNRNKDPVAKTYATPVYSDEVMHSQSLAAKKASELESKRSMLQDIDVGWDDEDESDGEARGDGNDKPAAGGGPTSIGGSKKKRRRIKRTIKRR
jgi:hypothetical protein